MTPNEIRAEISSSIMASWATATPICWPNQPFVSPQQVWIRPTIKMGDTLVGELGEDGLGMRTGVLIVSIFDLAGKGTISLLNYAARLERMFRRKEISNIVFNEPSTNIIGLDENGYYGANMSVDFTAWVGES